VRVVIASAARDSVASRALSVEGIDVVVVVCRGDYGYGNLLADLWTTGGFVLVEDDVAPWPGAIAELLDCPHDWCAFDYPIGGGRMMSSCSHWGLGLVKVTDELVAAAPSVADDWRGIHWRQLDKLVNAAIARIAGRARAHLHGPAVAHARHFRP
jgi:hypothetical protein